MLAYPFRTALLEMPNGEFWGMVGSQLGVWRVLVRRLCQAGNVTTVHYDQPWLALSGVQISRFKAGVDQ